MITPYFSIKDIETYIQNNDSNKFSLILLDISNKSYNKNQLLYALSSCIFYGNQYLSHQILSSIKTNYADKNITNIEIYQHYFQYLQQKSILNNIKITDSLYNKVFTYIK